MILRGSLSSAAIRRYADDVGFHAEVTDVVERFRHEAESNFERFGAAERSIVTQAVAMALEARDHPLRTTESPHGP